jgi:CheY-like chemotaxis protein
MAKQTIVVADDDSDYLDLIKELLIYEGYPSVHCIAGPGAYALIKQIQPNLVLLDLNVGQSIPGWQVLDMLRLHPATANIPVILCSTDMRLLQEKAAHLLACNTQTRTDFTKSCRVFL